jgi:hypothetical protein
VAQALGFSKRASCISPLLVMAGDRDMATPWQGRLEIVARGIPDAKVAHLPAAHIPNVEVSGEFNRAVPEFLLTGVKGWPELSSALSWLRTNCARRRTQSKKLSFLCCPWSLCSKNDFCYNASRLDQ